MSEHVPASSLLTREELERVDQAIAHLVWQDWWWDERHWRRPVSGTNGACASRAGLNGA